MYMTLTRAGNAFRMMKSPLVERPILHHKENQVNAHLFMCMLAYYLLVAIETTLLSHDVHTS
jgi:transposase